MPKCWLTDKRHSDNILEAATISRAGRKCRVGRFFDLEMAVFQELPAIEIQFSGNAQEIQTELV
jgi:hypothetical protein